MEDRYIFPIEEKDEEGNIVIVDYFMLHRSVVTVEELVKIGKEIGCIE